MVYLCRIPGWSPDKQVIYYPVLVFGKPIQDMCDFLFSDFPSCLTETKDKYQKAKEDRYYDEWHVIVFDTDANIQIFFLDFYVILYEYCLLACIMKSMKFIALLIFLFLLSSCASLRPATYTGNTSLVGYKYAYITPTSGLSSSSGGVYGNEFGIYDTTVSKSINPSDVISGILMKNGYILLPEIEDNIRDRTVIVNYGETGRRYILGGLFGYTIEVTLQILSADTHEVLCTCTAEGQGETEADDIRIAITRALAMVFPD